MEILRTGCTTPAMSRGEAVRYGLLVIGAACVCALLVVGLKLTVGENIWTEALALSTASIAPLLYMLILMREYSLRTRVVLTGAMFAFIYAVSLLSIWI